MLFAAMPKELPTIPGVYLCRESGIDYWDSVLIIKGDSPFLQAQRQRFLGMPILTCEASPIVGPRIDNLGLTKPIKAGRVGFELSIASKPKRTRHTNRRGKK